MATADDASRLCFALPDAVVGGDADRLEMMVAGKAFAWTYLAREAPRRPRRPRRDVLAVRRPLDLEAVLIEAQPGIYFDDDHYRAYPAVLIRLAEISEDDLAARRR